VTDAANGQVTPRLNLRAAMGLSCTPTVTPRAWRTRSTGGTYTFTVTPPSADCTWNVAAPSASWLRIVGSAAGTEQGNVTLQVDPASAAARSTGLVATSPDTAGSTARAVSHTILISQGTAAATVTDTTAPTMPRRGVRGSSANGAITLTWPAATDAQSGVSSYRVVYSEGRQLPESRCATGTPVNTQATVSGTNLTVAVPGLTVGGVYTFRVCSIDAAGNVALGAIWRGTVA
jgi:hypothetical protein